jgi:hypothetical protein
LFARLDAKMLFQILVAGLAAAATAKKTRQLTEADGLCCT